MADELWVRPYFDGRLGGNGRPWNIGTREQAQQYANEMRPGDYLEVLNTGERFYPEPPKPAPERVGAVAKRVRKLYPSGLPQSDPGDLDRLLACAEASDEMLSAPDFFGPELDVWRRTVTREGA